MSIFTFFSINFKSQSIPATLLLPQLYNLIHVMFQECSFCECSFFPHITEHREFKLKNPWNYAMKRRIFPLKNAKPFFKSRGWSGDFASSTFYDFLRKFRSSEVLSFSALARNNSSRLNHRRSHGKNLKTKLNKLIHLHAVFVGLALNMSGDRSCFQIIIVFGHYFVMIIFCFSKLIRVPF